MAIAPYAVAADEPGVSLTVRFARDLREQILSGQKPPNVRLNLEDLKEEFGISLSPIREGLAHLVAEGFVVPVGQRGYRVAPISSVEMREIMDLRIDLELRGLRQSIERGAEPWEVAVISSYRRLRSFEETPWGERDAAEYESLNLSFHRALVSGCNAPVLVRLIDNLAGMADRYRRLFLKLYAPDRDVPREHAEIYEAALARDSAKACAALRLHITHTSQNILLLLSQRDKEISAKPPLVRMGVR